ncbi:hypothetical protein B7R22_05305 [Subtercola boreus]|uniref:Uncharacterized protein n=1 Tax=Subtercola boreus TaxID=120213 RepID=A0A3E0W1Y5_9MICO|nr:hypothetical protein [Subtercola boreus]RFA15825.1 hypothetical protein B7R22_05305 [Subtercola boreus]
MTKTLQQGFRFVFELIAEPRVIRLIMFAIYITFLAAGLLVIQSPSNGIMKVLGPGLVIVFGTFLAVGGLLGSVAVLPGVWWLERGGIIAAVTGLLMYMVIIVVLGTSAIGFPVALMLIGFLVIRWMEIRRYQLAPRR